MGKIGETRKTTECLFTNEYLLYKTMYNVQAPLGSVPAVQNLFAITKANLFLLLFAVTLL
jgi:hypothetical protein